MTLAADIGVQYRLQFQARSGSKVRSEDTVAVGELLYELANGNLDENGVPNISPQQIVDYAKQHPNHPISRYFEWDQEKAAEKYLLVQARQIVRSIGIVILKGGQVVETSAMVSTFVATEEGPRRAYVPTNEAFNRPELSRQVVEEAKRCLGDWLIRFRAFEGLSAATAQVNTIIKDLDEVEDTLPPNPPKRRRR